MIGSQLHKRIVKCLRVGWFGVGVVASGCVANGSLIRTAELENSPTASSATGDPTPRVTAQRHCKEIFR